jgi:uncharacterized protein (DUF697 family)
MRFWNVIKELSAQQIREEASRLFVLALVGDPEPVARARQLVLGEGITPEGALAADPFLFCAAPPCTPEEEHRLRHADLIVSLPGGPGLTEFRPAETIQVSDPEAVLKAVLEKRPDLRIALGRRLPGFRDEVSRAVIKEVSRVNGEFAAVSGISTGIPFLAPLFPAVAGTDVLVLTKNQVLMVFRLAAIHGEALDLKSRSGEVMTVIGGAFGWRTLARQVAGLLPGGLGIPVRVSIAYSATYTVGRAAQVVFVTGRRPSRREMGRIYEEGSHLARELGARLRARLRRGEKPEEVKSLAETAEAPDLEPAAEPAQETTER